MITFKDFLLEKKMSGSAYGQTLKRLEEDALIGFEIEVFVPTGSFYHRDPDQDPAKKLKLTDIGTWNEIQMYFDVSRQQEGAILGEFEAWKTEKEDDWVDQNWEEFVTDENDRNAEREARRQALKQATNKYTWDMWFTQEFEDIHEFLAKYELEPSHGWVDDHHVNQHAPQSSGYYSGFKNTANAMAEHLGRVLKTTVRVNAQGYATWNLTHDNSIKDSEGLDDESGQDGVGVEIVSPPTKPSKAIAQLELVLKTLDEYGIETNESTGIHVNISLPNLKNFDPLKLVLFMGDKHVLKKFDRLANTFTNSQFQRVIDSISLTGKVPRSADELIRLGREGLEETGKHFSVNLNHLPKYLEFRAAGGQDYHKRVYDIKEAIGRWLSAVETAATPDMHRNEYLKKVMKLIDKTPEAEEAKRLSDADMSLEQLVRAANGSMAWDEVQAALEGDDHGYKVRALTTLFITISKHLDKLTISLPLVKEMRTLMKTAGVTMKEMQDLRSGSLRTQLDSALQKFKLLPK